MRGLLTVILGVALLIPAVSSRAQESIPVQAGSTLEHDTVTVGDVVRLTVRVRAPKGATINFPAAVDSLGPVQALEPPSVRSGSDSATASDRIAVYRLAAWDVGRLQVKLGDVVVQTDGGERRVALTLPSLFVKSVLPSDSAKRIPKPARPLIAARAPVPWWWWVLAAVAAVAISGGAWWWARRRRRLPEGLDPYAAAMAAFDRIERLKLLNAGEPGRHAAAMADVVRAYLSARLPAVSLAMTSRELLEAVRQAPTVSAESLRLLFEAVDPIKFARAPLDEARARALGDAAKTLVREEHRRAEDLAVAERTQQERAA